MIGHKLYAGAGDHLHQDFWMYDLLTGIWTRLKDAPLAYSTHHNAALVNNGVAYVFEYSRLLWKYDPATDLWTAKAPFIQPRRTVSTMVSFGNSLYLLGGTYYQYPYQVLQDCWEYSIASNTWELNSFMPEWFSYGMSVVYHDHIVAGMGYVVKNLNEVDRQVLYQFVP